MESILTSVKKLLGMTEEYAVFDTDLIMHINSVFMIRSALRTRRRRGAILRGNGPTLQQSRVM